MRLQSQDNLQEICVCLFLSNNCCRVVREECDKFVNRVRVELPCEQVTWTSYSVPCTRPVQLISTLRKQQKHRRHMRKKNISHFRCFRIQESRIVPCQRLLRVRSCRRTARNKMRESIYITPDQKKQRTNWLAQPTGKNPDYCSL